MDEGSTAVDAREVSYDLDLWCEDCGTRITDQAKARMDAHEVNPEQAAAVNGVEPGMYHALCCPLPECRS